MDGALAQDLAKPGFLEEAVPHLEAVHQSCQPSTAPSRAQLAWR